LSENGDGMDRRLKRELSRNQVVQVSADGKTNYITMLIVFRIGMTAARNNVKSSEYIGIMNPSSSEIVFESSAESRSDYSHSCTALWLKINVQGWI
jgi:hypothetical protein